MWNLLRNKRNSNRIYEYFKDRLKEFAMNLSEV